MGIKEIYKIFLEGSGICIDTRNIKENCLFFALKGPNFDANKFTAQAIEKGAVLAVIDNKEYFIKGKTYLVDDVLEFLQKFAQYHRKQLTTKVISITGSNGKTTTKELTHAVLSKKYKTTATKGNYNNHIGVPLTLLEVDNSAELSIVELGANHQGEIAELCKIAMPDFGYITNYGKAHLEGFGGVEGVIKGKSELYKYLLSTNAKAFINADDSIQVEKSKNIDSIALVNDVFIDVADPFLRINYKGNIIQTSLVGDYNLNNIRFAISVGEYFGVPIKDIKDAIESYQPDNNRSEQKQINGNTYIMDAYNANPSSMFAAIENFAKLDADLKVVILGDMFELGEYSFDEHKKIVEKTLECEFDKSIFIGAEFYKHRNNSGDFYLSSEDLNREEVFSKLKNAQILIKGSRGMALEKLVME
jgi:UDP-N-acetylmuramoyl-tripeptide--D-alanyl-D-alanine ligase